MNKLGVICVKGVKDLLKGIFNKGRLRLVGLAVNIYINVKVLKGDYI